MKPKPEIDPAERKNPPMPELLQSPRSRDRMENVKRLLDAGFPWAYAWAISKGIMYKARAIQNRTVRAGQAKLKKLRGATKAVKKLGRKHRGR